MIRLNITIPEDVAEQLHHIRNKSQFISRALKEKFDREKTQKLEKALIEGYKETASEDRRTAGEWDNATLEGWK
ncbi:MAG: hypothetical protein A3G91_02530 [Omnitrophica WOR_2 bacterium RIFCSPLOWO2_12_FULL_50_9]|nr:MAG: hypothetical protein A3G91_02530 [Omnitrophica WOR_2 bacterium RIFCSPLOWO2_12_FULL_50_9]